MKQLIKGLVLPAVLCLPACHHAPEAAPIAATPAALHAQSAEFKREILNPADGVYVAIGYGIANSILLVGDDGVIVVDTTETAESAREVLAAFRKITDKPVKAIVYTHSHPDHIGGAAVFAAGRDVPVYAQRELVANMQRTSIELQTAITRRSQRMYGMPLPADQVINVGIGPFVDMHADSTVDTLPPTRVFDEQLEDTVAGIHFRLVHAPGETGDQLFMWLPERHIVLSGDNFYRAFPNLYTIRGTSYRDPRAWADSIDKLRALHAEVLVPSHTRPLVGADRIEAALTDYRDAIRYVYDQTIRLINQGRTPDEIAATLRLPAHLASSPYLQTFYGNVPWSAREIYSGLLGWYDGDPASLQPLAPDDTARHMIALAGGIDALAKQITDAESRGEHQWVLQLSGYALRVVPDRDDVRKARIAALRALGAAESNPNARHWYQVSAGELAGEYKLPARVVKPTPAMLARMPLARFFDGMAVNLDPQASGDETLKVGFEFTDVPERYTYIVRQGASEVVPAITDDADIVVRVSAQTFKEMLAQLRNPALTIASDFTVVKGSKLGFVRFMRWFVPDAS
ncbi:alkyl sulfatase dimerization domain-containing protein [Solimonas terrae]|uniref:MBL fold metallo-hydrolase n=1 Tax=Solimonas terrae TaxID=1396819 RepID=A0A6M2BW55_9GAMM|nr:alkyl sulfatase dimerization domain-containing protein [Solimonas terrae]NGY06872.1 MBL fold metallo-hydrolase [Solimonas terrae]